MDFPFGDLINVITRAKSGVDEYGNDVFTESTITVRGAFDPAIGFESTAGGQDVVSSQPQAYLPYGTPVTSTSVLLINGARFQVDGVPGSWASPFTGRQFGVQVPLKRVV